MRRATNLLLALLSVATLAFAASPARAESVAANSGLPGSRCEATDGGLAEAEPDETVTTTSLGSDAPAYYEVGMPSGEFDGQSPKAIMLVIHGGGWFMVGAPVVAAHRYAADAWRDRGWMTVNITYRACSTSITDVLWFMRRVRELHPKTPVCAQGGSAGGHLALILASIRPDLACAIAVGAPTSLTAFTTQSSWNYSRYSYDAAGPSTMFNWATAAFGQAIGASSPIRYVKNVRARVLIASGEHDALIPAAQTHSYAAALRLARPWNYVDSVVLEPGKVPFVHGGISRAAAADFDKRINALVAPIERRIAQ